MSLRDRPIFARFAFYSFIFLLPVWFILHANNEYFGLIPPELSLLYFFRYLLITAGFVFLAILLFRRKPAAGAIFSAVLFFCFFLFGAALDQARSITTGFISSYTFLLPALLLFLIAVFLLLRYSGHGYLKLHSFLKWLVLVFIALEIVLAIYHFASGRQKQNDLSGDNRAFPAPACSTAKPDIFFIVFDEYPSSASLKEDLGFDNSHMDSLLNAAGFFVAKQSVSNYNVSPFALSSALDAGYLKAGIEKRSDAKLFIQALETYEENRLVAFLHGLGYTIKNLGCFDLEQAPLSTDHYFDDMYEKMLDGGTLWSRVDRDIGWKFRLKNFFTGEFRVPPGHIKLRDYHIYRNNFNFSELTSELQRSHQVPRFVVTHLMLPHEPFLVKADGSLRSDTAVLTNSISPKEGFLDQVQYANKLLEEILTIGSKNTGRDKIIMIQGDHGYRFFEKASDRSKEFRNLNAIYFPDRDYKLLYDSISSVNSFRVLLNKYFCQQLPMLRDSSVFISTVDP